MPAVQEIQRAKSKYASYYVRDMKGHNASTVILCFYLIVVPCRHSILALQSPATRSEARINGLQYARKSACGLCPNPQHLVAKVKSTGYARKLAHQLVRLLPVAQRPLSVCARETVVFDVAGFVVSIVMSLYDAVQLREYTLLELRHKLLREQDGLQHQGHSGERLPADTPGRDEWSHLRDEMWVISSKNLGTRKAGDE